MKLRERLFGKSLPKYGTPRGSGRYGLGRGVIPVAIKAEQEDIDRRARETDCLEALDAATLAIDEYYNGDRVWAEKWLLTAFNSNKAKA